MSGVGLVALREAGIELRSGDAFWWVAASEHLIGDEPMLEAMKGEGRRQVGLVKGVPAGAVVETAAFSGRYLEGVIRRNTVTGGEAELGSLRPAGCPAVVLAYWRAPR